MREKVQIMKFWRGKEFVGVGRLGLTLGLAILAVAFETVTNPRSRCRLWMACNAGRTQGGRHGEERGKKVERSH